MASTPPNLTRRKSGWVVFVLVFTGVASLVLYRAGLRADGTKDIAWFLKLVSAQTALYFIAAWSILRVQTTRSFLMTVILFAVLFRLAILFSPPYLSDDIYRYVWDGRVQAAGINPYRYVPADQSLVRLRDDTIYTKINRREYAHTIYPPVAQLIYFLTTRLSESVTWMKVTMLGFEAIAVWGIAQLLASFGLPRRRILIYAWHPLVVWEIAGSGHVDALAIAFMMLALLARRRNAEVLVGITLACAVLVKLFPLVLFPALYKRWNWRLPLAFAATVAVAYLPYLGAGPVAVLGYLPGYVTEQGLSSGEQFYVLNVTRWLLPGVNNTLFLIFFGLTMLAIAAWSVFKEERDGCSYIKRASVLAAAVIVLFAPHYSWYFAWLVPFLCFVPSISLFYLTAAGFALYGSWLGDTPEQMFWLNTAIYLPLALLLVAEPAARRLKKRDLLEKAA